MVRPEEALESFPKEGKHESVPRVRYKAAQTHRSLQASVGGKEPRLEMLDCKALVFAGLRLGCVFHRQDTIPAIPEHSCCSCISLGAQIANNASASPRVLGRSVLLAGHTGSTHREKLSCRETAGLHPQ